MVGMRGGVEPHAYAAVGKGGVVEDYEDGEGGAEVVEVEGACHGRSLLLTACGITYSQKRRE